MNIYKCYDYDYEKTYRGIIILCDSIEIASKYFRSIYGNEPKRIKILNTIQDQIIIVTGQRTRVRHRDRQLIE